MAENGTERGKYPGPGPEAGVEVPREEGFDEAAAKPERLEEEPAVGVEHEVVKGEELKETVDEKREKVDGLKQKAEGLIERLPSAEEKEAAEQEFARLNALSEENSKALGPYKRWIGLEKTGEFELNADLAGWTKFVLDLKVDLKDVDKGTLESDPELKRREGEFVATYKVVERQIGAYENRRAQERADHRQHLSKMAGSVARFRF